MTKTTQTWSKTVTLFVIKRGKGWSLCHSLVFQLRFCSLQNPLAKYGNIVAKIHVARCPFCGNFHFPCWNANMFVNCSGVFLMSSPSPKITGMMASASPVTSALAACPGGFWTRDSFKYLGLYLEDHPTDCKWITTMVNKSPNWGCSPSKWCKWRIHRGY